jgi:erythromycin esterase-like protein
MDMARAELKAVDAVRSAAIPLAGAEGDAFTPLLEIIGDARLVLLGEATHGTHEFYRARAEITRRLIEDKGFTAVLVEADWPDASRVNRYVHGIGDDPDADGALSGFRRFPQWMWRNTDIVNLVEWMRRHNKSLGAGAPPAGFYGMDLYSLHGSIEAVLQYLEQVDPAAAKRARYRYGCFEQFGEDPQAYGYAASFDLERSCEDQAVEQLRELQRQRSELLRRDGRLLEDEQFFAEQNARLVQNAERYYRAMFSTRTNTWNLRDTHMADTLDALLGHLERYVGRAKVAIWAHNSHLGDARATEMGRQGELNVGQLVRQRHGGESVLVGFTTHSGHVTAASGWGGKAERKRVRPGMAGSYEALFDDVGEARFMLDLRQRNDAVEQLRRARLERAIGVIYLPQTERVSHYFTAVLPEQFDAVIHYNQTSALVPLERTGEWERGELPETYPFTV